MSKWGKFHATEHSAQCTAQHTEHPVCSDDLPHLWNQTLLWDRARRLLTLSNDVPPNPRKLHPGDYHDPAILSGGNVIP